MAIDDQPASGSSSTRHSSEGRKNMRIPTCILAAASLAIAVASHQAVAQMNDGLPYTPVPGRQFESALTPEQLATELQLNVSAFGLPHRTPVEAKAAKAGTVNIFGSVRNNFGADVCGLVLANGNFMFSCSPNGSYTLTTGLDSNNQVTLFGFAEGHFPYKSILGASGGRFDIVLNVATVSPPPPPITNSNISFTITDSCHDGWAIDYKFYDEDDNLVWPSATTHYFTTLDDTPYTQALSCVTGALVCYGARNENPLNTGFWGVDVDNSKTCADCCIRCQQGASLSRRLSC
jgi:hypothetical protein